MCDCLSVLVVYARVCEFVFLVDLIYLKINLILEMFALSTVPRSRDQLDILDVFIT